MNSQSSKIKSRNPILAFFLALFFPSFGQIYNGQIKKGILFLLISLTLPFIFGISRVGTFFAGFIVIVVVDFSFRIYVIFDAVVNARRLKNYNLKPHNTWYYHLIIMIVIGAIFWNYDYHSVIGVRSYHTETTANQPALHVADRTLVDLKAFKSVKPNYGDIVVFQKKDSVNPWVYRVVALPNDKLEVDKGFLTINGVKCKAMFVKKAKSEMFNVNEYEEELPNGHKHRIYTFENVLRNSEEPIQVTVPANSYFLMGDNRDNAMDSRYIGAIKEDEIIGKVLFAFWGNTTDRINVSFTNQ